MFELMQPLWKSPWRFLKKTKNRITIWPRNSIGYALSKQKALIWKDTCPPMFIAALFTMAKIQKQSKCSSIHSGILLSCKKKKEKKKENFSIWNIIDGLEGYCMLSHICEVWKISEYNKKKQSHRQREQTGFTRGKRAE